MLPRGGRRHVGAAVVLAAVLALAVAAPAGAVGWGGWNEARELADSLVPRVLAWLRLGTESRGLVKCDNSMHIDPNGGCSKAVGVQRGWSDRSRVEASAAPKGRT